MKEQALQKNLGFCRAEVFLGEGEKSRLCTNNDNEALVGRRRDVVWHAAIVLHVDTINLFTIRVNCYDIRYSKEMNEKHVFFARHAQSEANEDTIARGSASKLSEKGADQAKKVAARMGALTIDALIASPFVRTMHTAEEIAATTGRWIEVNDLFIERRSSSQRLGKALNDEGIRELEQAIFDGYGIPGYRHSDEENFDDLKARAFAALDYLAQRPETRLCVVSHGVFLKVLACATIHGPEFTGKEMQHFIHSFDGDNTGIFYFRYAENAWKKGEMEWRIRSWNDLAHFGDAV